MQRWKTSLFPLVAVALGGMLSLGCADSGVGDPCIPEDEYRVKFGGYAANEVNVESKSFQCETRVCMAAYFQGRVSCPYGQEDSNSPSGCFIPGRREAAETRIAQSVPPQKVDRRPDDSVYCSCRCDGPDKAITYCECPSGFVCEKMVEDLGFGSGQLAGSYCVKDGTQVDDPGKVTAGADCSEATGSCGDPKPFGFGAK
ncbi:MAG: hypothetical protein FJ104_08605 [Deltaproteobacteria bacterium]|nr:hypothetical protein [Deltaproteobacteria bacterium]